MKIEDEIVNAFDYHKFKVDGVTGNCEVCRHYEKDSQHHPPKLVTLEHAQQAIKEESIKFALWVSRYWIKMDLNKYHFYQSKGGTNEYKTLQELYELYLKQK